jgi:hypothetical protein
MAPKGPATAAPRIAPVTPPMVCFETGTASSALFFLAPDRFELFAFVRDFLAMFVLRGVDNRKLNCESLAIAAMPQS